MQQNRYEKMFDEFMSMTEFALIKYPNNMWGVVDLQGGNFGDIEDDRFDNAAQIFERMDIYIKD